MSQTPKFGGPPNRGDELRYLLGRMPESEREEFGQRLIHDAGLYDRVCETEAELLDAYARGELSAEDRADVERCIMATGRQRQRARFASAWSARESRRPSGKSELSRWLGWLAAVAAVMVIAVILLWRGPGTRPSQPEIATLVLPGSTIRSGEIPTFPIAQSATQVEIRIPVEPTLEQGALQGSLRNERAVELWRGSLSRSAPRFLTLRVDRSVLSGTSFELAVLREGTDEALAYFYFRITK